MLFLLFQIGSDRYALDAARVTEILPLVFLKGIPGAPPGVAGLLNHRGSPVPVLDLHAMLLGGAAENLLGTRLALVRHTAPGGEQRLLGLIVERATEMARFEPDAFIPGGVRSDGVPYLGPVAVAPGQEGLGLIQRIEVDQLLTPEARQALFGEPASAS